VEGSEEVVEAAAAAAAAPQGDLLVVHQAVPGAQAHQVAHRVVPGLEALLHPVADLAVHLEPAKSLDSLDRTGYPLSPMALVRVLVLASWEDFAGVGFLDPLLVGTAGGAVATTGRPPVETILLTRWSQLWQKGRNWEPLAEASPSGSMFVGLEGG
jgi:hypothetical protein